MVDIDVTKEDYKTQGYYDERKFPTAYTTLGVKQLQVKLVGLVYEDIDDAIRKLSSPRFGFDAITDDLKDNNKVLTEVVHPSTQQGGRRVEGIIGKPYNLQDLVDWNIDRADRVIDRNY